MFIVGEGQAEFKLDSAQGGQARIFFQAGEWLLVGIPVRLPGITGKMLSGDAGTCSFPSRILHGVAALNNRASSGGCGRFQTRLYQGFA